MNGLYITVDGVVGTDPKKSVWNGNPILSFRLVANERRFDRIRNAWVDVHASWITVSCFRELARNVGESISKGDRLIVHGKMRVKDFLGDDGVQRTVVTVEADGVGHSLLFGTTQFRPTRAEDNADAQIRAQADELVRELAAEPTQDLATLLAERASLADDLDPNTAPQGNGDGDDDDDDDVDPDDETASDQPISFAAGQKDAHLVGRRHRDDPSRGDDGFEADMSPETRHPQFAASAAGHRG